MRRPKMSSQRGMSLIEGMISMAVLVIGILGALQGILFASQQNSVAARLARATSMAAQIRLGIEAQGFATMVGLIPSGGGAREGPSSATPKVADTTVCIPASSASAALKALTDGLAAMPGACIIDVDAYDWGTLGGGTGSPASALDKLVPSYDAADYTGPTGAFRRVVVYIPSADTGSATGAFSFAAVVSTPDTGRRIFVKQFAAMYDYSPSATPANPAAAGNGGGVGL